MLTRVQDPGHIDQIKRTRNHSPQKLVNELKENNHEVLVAQEDEQSLSKKVSFSNLKEQLSSDSVQNEAEDEFYHCAEQNYQIRSMTAPDFVFKPPLILPVPKFFLPLRNQSLQQRISNISARVCSTHSQQVLGLKTSHIGILITPNKTIDSQSLQKQHIYQTNNDPVTSEVSIEMRHCLSCDNEQPLRARHCQWCKRCVPTYDHHCPWMGICVGEKNKLSYITYLLFQNIQIDLSIAKSIENYQQHIPLHNCFALSLLGLAFLSILGIATLILMLHQLYYIFQNITTWEHISWKNISYLKNKSQKLGSPFSQGPIHNIKTFLKYSFTTGLYQWNDQ